ncbi:transposase [Nonomuraea sp. NBC_01738]|nr:transposase [Nonomuraea sp. NBC_01738]
MQHHATGQLPQGNESHIRYGGVGGIAYHYVADTYIALFTRFIPCGVWEAVHLIEGLLANTSDTQPDTIHADTQGQSLPVFTLAHLFGFDLVPRIRNWKDLTFFLPFDQARYQHIDALFGESGRRQAIDWTLIETHWPDLMRAALSIREGKLNSVTLMRRLSSRSRKNHIYRAFREVGRAVRTTVLLRYLADAKLRARVDAATNKAEAYNGFTQWLRFASDVLERNDPAEQEKLVKFTNLLANLVAFHTALDLTEVIRSLISEGWQISAADIATLSPYLTRHIRRFGAYATDELTTPPGSYDPHLSDVDFTDLRPAA